MGSGIGTIGPSTRADLTDHITVTGTGRSATDICPGNGRRDEIIDLEENVNGGQLIIMGMTDITQGGHTVSRIGSVTETESLPSTAERGM